MFVRWKEKVQNVTLQDRIRGSFIGGAAGDALGYAVEFMTLREISRVYGEGGIREYDLDPLTGEALISDDTQMTLFTANGILRGETLKKLDAAQEPSRVHIYEAYLDWLKTQYVEPGISGRKSHGSWLLGEGKLHNRRAPGGTCLHALMSGDMGCLDEPLNDSCGCGGVMRVAPVGLYWKNLSAEEVMILAAEAAVITHGHPMGYIPAGVLAFIIHRIVYGGEMDLYKIVHEAQESVPKVFGENDMSERMVNFLTLAELISRNESEEDWPNIARLGEGWVGDEALAIAVYCCLRYHHDFNACICAAVNHDGDSDSTGAIAGNIMGALYGYENLDQKWKDNLELKDVILEIADDLYLGVPETEESDRFSHWIKKYREGKK